jgi:hypothetical protein
MKSELMANDNALPRNKLLPEPNSPEKPPPACSECERLWRVYTLNTRKYLEVTLAEGAAAQTNDIAKVRILEEEALEAAKLRELARQAVRNHAATHQK